MDLFIENPLTFRSEYFIENVFLNQHNEVVLNFMLNLTTRWLLADLKIFDFNFYLIHFFKKCINDDKIATIGRYL